MQLKSFHKQNKTKKKCFLNKQKIKGKPRNNRLIKGLQAITILFYFSFFFIFPQKFDGDGSICQKKHIFYYSSSFSLEL